MCNYIYIYGSGKLYPYCSKYPLRRCKQTRKKQIQIQSQKVFGAVRYIYIYMILEIVMNHSPIP